ncbi:MAG: M4 family metallopeptidase [Bacteroidia bacterium]
MHIIEIWEDSFTNIIHRKYQQYYKNIKMENITYVEHVLNGYVIISNGYVCEDMDQTSIPVLTESEALDIALEDAGEARVFAWQDDSLEYFLRHDSLGTDTTYFPKGELLYAYIGDTVKASNFKLAWKFRIWAVDTPVYEKYVYVNAVTGEILRATNVLQEGSFNHRFYGTKYDLDTRWYGGTKQKFFLEANDGGRNIRTKDNNDKSWEYSHLSKSGDDVWGNDNWSATSGHWSVSKTWDYWADVWKRNGVDNNWRPLKVQTGAHAAAIANGGVGFKTNAYGNGADGIFLGNMDIDAAVSLDIVGHEYSHGVGNNTVRFGDGGEAGALNESYADIFGFLTETHVLGFQNFTIGENATLNRRRNLADPKNETPNDPDGCLPADYPITFRENCCWADEDNFNCDKGGEHHNANVQNFCFFLLAMGGTHPNSLVTVNAIGIEKASQIVHLAFTSGLLTSTSGFKESKKAWETASAELFGRCSFENIETCKAWSAVGIPPDCPCLIIQVPPCWDNLLRASAEPAPLSTHFNKNYKLRVFPNPASKSIKIDVSGLSPAKIKSIEGILIMDLNGKQIMNVIPKNSNPIVDIDISELPVGVYYIKVQFPDWQFINRFVKLEN